jgi:hypothetical protein
MEKEFYETWWINRTCLKRRNEHQWQLVIRVIYLFICFISNKKIMKHFVSDYIIEYASKGSTLQKKQERLLDNW